MTTELLLKFEFLASHSLSVREEPHAHLWRMEVVLLGEPREGMIVNLPEVRTAFETVIASLSNTFLNENPLLDAMAKAAPTCETLCAFFFRSIEGVLNRRFLLQNPTLKLKSVQVAICEPDGFEWGAARLTKA
ncbi:MAG: 6-carboxytetrahydropterin synthase [Chloroherpetonaceae bacterium]